MLNTDVKDITIREPSINIRKVVRILAKNWWLFILSVLIALSIAFLVNRYSDRIYVVSTLLIKESKGSSSDIQEVLYGQDLFGNKSKDVINEIAILESYDLIESTLRELAFSVSYYNSGSIRNDELYNRSPIFVAIDTTQSQNIPYSTIFKCQIFDTSTYLLTTESPSLLTQIKNHLKNEPEIPLSFLNKKLKFNQIYDIDGVRFSLILNSKAYSAYEDDVVLFKVHPYTELLNDYRNKITITPYAEESTILRISVEGTNRDKSLDYLNKHLMLFINGELNNKNQMASKTIDFINHQILAMSDSLSLIESKLETLKKSNTSLSVKEQSGTFLEESRALQDDRNIILLSNDYLSNLQTYLSNDELDKVFLPSSLGITDASLNRSIEQLVDLRLEIQVMESDKNLSNPLIRIKRQQIQSLRQNISEIIRGLKEANNLRLNSINNTIQGLSSSIQNIPTAERKLKNIERMHQLSENMYLFLMQKKAEAGIAKASNAVDYRVIDDAKYAGISPIKPNPTLNYIVALFMSLLIPGAFLFIKELLNDTIETKEDLTVITSIPILGSVIKEKKKISQDEMDPFVAESYRMIRSNIRYLTRSEQGSFKTFLITSSVSGEGKTFNSVNLALFFSNFGKKVLFVSLDMRKGEKYQIFNTKTNDGLSEYLSGNAPISEIIYRTTFKNLDFTPPGGIPPNPTELLINGKIDHMIDMVGKNYDYLILDSPPVGIIADAVELMQKVDLNIYVVRSKVTIKGHIKDLDAQYKKGYYKNLVFILNCVEQTSLSYTYDNYYKKGYTTQKMKSL